jgi:hypothetical protein
MPRLIPIVEGDGEVKALPLLLRRLFGEIDQIYDFEIAKPKNAHGCGGLTTPDGIERFVKYALIEPDCEAVLVLIDNDATRGLPENQALEDDCAPALAHYLAQRINGIHPSKPVVVVVARWEYEAWLLASLETAGQAIGLPAGIVYDGDVESVRSAKSWINQRLPPGRKYSETRDQVSMTASLDFGRVESRSPSFRRLKHALEEVVDAYLEGEVIVTPLGESSVSSSG